jgi:hypothetical protein
LSPSPVALAFGLAFYDDLPQPPLAYRMSCCEPSWLQLPPTIHVLCHEPGPECLHGPIYHGRFQLEQQVLQWTRSIPYVRTSTICPVHVRLLVDLVTRVYDLRPLVRIALLSRFVNLIGLVTLQRKCMGAYIG